MKTLALTIAVIAALLAVLATRSPVDARQASLEDRVRSLETQVASLNLRVTKLEGREGGGGSGGGGWNDGIRRVYTGIGDTWIIKSFHTRSNTMVLGNDTRWEHRSEDATLVSAWNKGDVILIGINRDKNWPYMLTNETKKQRIVAKYIANE